MPRIVATITARMWLLLLLASFAFAGPEGAISFRTLDALIGDSITAVVFGVVIASICFAYRPRRWLAMLLLLASVAMALPFSYGLWVHFSLHAVGTVVTPRFHWTQQLYLGAAIVFIALALLWAVICLRLRDVAAKT
jgi:hypothetical protein